MALGFFRRRQKMMIIIMVALMVSFLVGYQGLSMLFSKKPGDVLVGRTRLGDLTYGRQSAADADLRYLDQLGLIDRNKPYAPGKFEYIFFREMNSPGAAMLGYAMLLDEAKEAGTVVLNSEVDAFFEAMGLAEGSAEYDAKISEFREKSIPSKWVRSAVARWLAVYKTYMEAQVDTPPSEPEALRYYRDENEKIGLRVVRLAAKDFVKETDNVTDAQIVKQFNTYRMDFPGIRPDMPLEKFAFGYRQPNRVQIDYLLLALEPIARGVQVTDVEVMNYWKENKGQFVRREAVSRPASSSAPSTQTTMPAEPPTEYRTVVMKFSEAYEPALVRVKMQKASRIIQEVLAHAQQVLTRIEQDTSGSSRPLYERVREAMFSDAKKRLDRKVKVRIVSQPLDRAIAILAKTSGVGICFPWGVEGTWKLADPKNVKVSLKGDEMTLGAALEKIVLQIKGWPKLSWSSCKGIRNPMIFPTGGVAMFPVVAGRTDLLGYRELSRDEILRSSYTAPRSGRRLPDVAFMAAEFVGDDRAQIRAGEKGPKMYARGDRRGMLLWRLRQAVATHILEAINTPAALDERLRKQVTEDAKILAGYAAALKRGKELKKTASDVGLDKAADADKLDSFVTGLFSRRISVGRLAQHLLSGQIELEAGLPSLLADTDVRGSIVSTLINLGVVGSFSVPDEVITALLDKIELRFRVFYALLMDRSVALRTVGGIVRGVPLPTRAVREHFMKAAFSLVPQNVDPPYPDKPYALAVTPLPANKEIIVMQRDDYRPIVRGEYESSGRARAMLALRFSRWSRSSSAWFRLSAIEKRLGFIREGQ